MKKGKQVTGNEVWCEKAMKLNLYPVEPNCSGEGLPYALVDWSNPGDTWRWWVRNIPSRSGFYKDRILYLPKRLCSEGSNYRFNNKSLLVGYISSQFPNADVDEFFASFSWMVPPRGITGAKGFEAQDVLQELRAQFCEDVDDCLKRLEHIFSQHNDEGRVQTPFTYVGPDMAEEMSTHRKKLSSILALDFKCLLSSKYLKEIAFSVEKLTADPNLTVDRLLKSKLVEEIPKAGEVFLRTKGIAKQATKFFGDLQAMKNKFSSIKGEFSELKKGAGELQSKIDCKSSLVREIDEQILQLQSKKAEVAWDLESTIKAKVQMVAEQEILANSISAVMRETQIAVAEIPIWEMQKKNAEKRMAEILARYAPPKGFSFEKSS